MIQVTEFVQNHLRHECTICYRQPDNPELQIKRFGTYGEARSFYEKTMAQSMADALLQWLKTRLHELEQKELSPDAMEHIEKGRAFVAWLLKGTPQFKLLCEQVKKAMPLLVFLLRDDASPESFSIIQNITDTAQRG
jgi:hypothetical protein